MTELKYRPEPGPRARARRPLHPARGSRAELLDLAMRGIGSSHADPFSAVAGACAALYGPLHGGANEAVLRMLAEIGTKDRVPAFIKEVKEGHGEKRLMGFGHRIYKNYDPRAKIIKKIADGVFDGHGEEPAARNRARAREDRARGRVLRQAQALSERRLLLRHHLSGDGPAHVDVHRAFRDRPDDGLDGPVGGDAPRPGAEDRAAAAGVYRAGGAAPETPREPVEPVPSLDDCPGPAPNAPGPFSLRSAVCSGRRRQVRKPPARGAALRHHPRMNEQSYRIAAVPSDSPRPSAPGGFRPSGPSTAGATSAATVWRCPRPTRPSSSRPTRRL